MNLSYTQHKGILFIAWGVSMLLSFSAPLLRSMTGIQGIGRWPIYTAVAVMLATWFLIRKAESAMFLALGMSASAITFGGALGLLAGGIGAGKTLPLLLAGKWAIFAGILTYMFWRQLKNEERAKVQESRFEWDTAEEEEKLRGMSPDERRRYLDGRFADLEREVEEVRKRTRRLWLPSVALLLVGAIAYGSSLWLKDRVEKSKERVVGSQR